MEFPFIYDYFLVPKEDSWNRSHPNNKINKVKLFKSLKNMGTNVGLLAILNTMIPGVILVAAVQDKIFELAKLILSDPNIRTIENSVVYTILFGGSDYLEMAHILFTDQRYDVSGSYSPHILRTLYQPNVDPMTRELYLDNVQIKAIRDSG